MEQNHHPTGKQPCAVPDSSKWQPMPQKIAEMLARYGNGKQFLQTFSPDLQQIAARYVDRVYFGTAPDLATVAGGYGEPLAVVWVCIQLESVNLYTGAKKKLSVEQQQELARQLLTDYPFLKVSELLLFFYRLKSGRYGRFYGAVDALLIASGVQSFLKERMRETASFKVAAPADRHPGAPSGHWITYDEYVALKKQKQEQQKQENDHEDESNL